MVILVEEYEIVVNLTKALIDGVVDMLSSCPFRMVTEADVGAHVFCVLMDYVSQNRGIFFPSEQKYYPIHLEYKRPQREGGHGRWDVVILKPKQEFEAFDEIPVWIGIEIKHFWNENNAREIYKEIDIDLPVVESTDGKPASADWGVLFLINVAVKGRSIFEGIDRYLKELSCRNPNTVFVYLESYRNGTARVTLRCSYWDWTNNYLVG